MKNRIIVTTVGASVLIYSILVGLPLFDSEVQAKNVEAFGSHPLGLPVTVVVVAAITLLYLPAPWFIWHMTQLIAQATEEGRRVRLGSLLFTPQEDPELQRSRLIFLGGVAYLAVICFTWIIYAAVREI